MRHKTTLTGFSILYAAAVMAAAFLLGSDIVHVLKVWLILLLTGAAFFPLTARLFRSFSDLGWIQSRLIGLTLAGAVSFTLILTHTMRFRRGPLLVCALLLTAAVWAGACFFGERGVSSGRHAGRRGAFSSILPAQGRPDLTLILAEELLFFCILTLWCYLYGFDVQGVLHTEGPFDYGILSTLMRSDTLPPADMWDCTRALDSYYYGGHYYTAFLTKLAGGRTNEMFTIGKALIPAASSAILFSTVWHFMRDRKGGTEPSASYAAGFLSVLLLMCSSNLHYLLYGLFRLPLPEAYHYGSPTRYIRGTITEFPAFSFILGDFHAHVINMMFVCCFLSLLYAWMQGEEIRSAICSARRGADGTDDGWQRPGSIFREVLKDPYIYILALFISVFFMNNTWDAPVYVLVYAAAVSLMSLRSREKKRLLKWFFRCALTAVLLFVFSSPFRSSFSTSAVRSLIVSPEHTPLHEFLILWGLQLSVIAALLLYTQKEMAPSSTGRGEIKFSQEESSLLLSMPPADARAAQGKFVSRADAQPGASPAEPDLKVYTHWFVRRQRGSAAWLRGLSLPDLFTLMTGFCAVCTIAAPEFVWVMDIFGGRMNTVFKTYFQGFVMLDTVCGYACLRLLLDARKLLPRVFGASAAVLFLLSCGYFSMGTAEHFGDVADRSGYAGIDAEIPVEQMLPEDAGAIRWLEENAEGQPHILEAHIGTGGICGRVSSLTGLPTVLGWYDHERQFFPDSEDVDRRRQDVRSAYTGTGETLVRHILEQYGIRYVFVGHEETQAYQVNHLLLQKLGNVVYRDEESGTYILEVS